MLDNHVHVSPKQLLEVRPMWTYRSTSRVEAKEKSCYYGTSHQVGLFPKEKKDRPPNAELLITKC